MNLKLYFFVFFIVRVFADENLVLLDSIAVLRIGASGLSPTYYSDEWFLNPFGMIKNLEEIVIQNIWLAYGNEHGIKMTADGSSNEYAEQYLDMLLEKRGVTRQKITQMTQELGYNIEDVKRELNNQYLVQQTIETFFAASGKLNITNDEINDFYNMNPIYQEMSFIIETGELELEDSIKIDMNDENIIKKISWSKKPYLVLEKDLNESFYNVVDCSPLEIIYYEYDKKKNNFLCYRLLEKKEKKKIELNELYEDITKQLQMLKYEEAYKNITEQFINSDNVIYDSPDIKKKCISFIKIEK
jgi:hypothetical protein